MFKWSAHKRGSIGLDTGATHLRAVQSRRRGKGGVLCAAGEMAIASGTGRDRTDRQQAARRLLEPDGFGDRRVVTGLPTAEVEIASKRRPVIPEEAFVATTDLARLERVHATKDGWLHKLNEQATGSLRRPRAAVRRCLR